jgi:ubiquinone/menaquinone biosynthesis C-methylase UbiE
VSNLKTAVETHIDTLSPADAYNVAAPYYDEWKWQRFWQHCELPLIASEVSAFVGTGRHRNTLVDVGCGTGRYLRQLADQFNHSIGVDVSERMLAIASQYASGRRLLRAEATSLPLPSSSADLVLSTRVLSHVRRPEQAIAEMARVLRPGGLLILSDVAAEHDYNQTRLPISDGHVFVETYKHSFSHLAELVGRFGLTLARSVSLVAEDNPEIRKFRLRAQGKLGWVAFWHLR